MVFFNVVFPVFTAILIGFIFGKVTKADTKVPSNMALYIFAPALFFNSLLTAKIDNSEFLRIILFTATLFVLFIILIYLISWMRDYSPKRRSALLLSAAFTNSNNYGLPIILFAFSQTGFEIAIVFSVFQNLLMNSAGVYFASSGSFSFKESLKQVLKMPGFIAVVASMTMKYFSISLPEAVLKPVQLLGQASIPTLLIVLGIQLSKINATLNLRFVGMATALKLVVYPALGFLLTPLFFPMGSLAAKVMLVISATPTAVITTILAIKYDTEPELVSSVTLVTTALSIITISVLLTILI